MNIAIIGRTQMLHAAALELVKAGHTIGVVITAAAAPEYTRGEDDFQKLARTLGCPFFLCGKGFGQEALKALQACDAAVSVNWVSVLGPEVLGLCPLGILNAHLGDLPRYRGNACPNWAILQGEERTTLSIHIMEPGELDCGRVVHQEHFPLTPETDIGHVYAWAESAVPKAFAAALARLGEAPDFSLYVAKATTPAAFRCHPRLPEDGFLDWNQPADQVLRLIRASGPPFAGAYTYAAMNGRLEKIAVLKARAVPGPFPDLAVPGHVLGHDNNEGSSLVACADAPLALLLCQGSDGTVYEPGRIWKGNRLRLGVRAEDMVWLWASAGPASQRNAVKQD